MPVSHNFNVYERKIYLLQELIIPVVICITSGINVTLVARCIRSFNF